MLYGTEAYIPVLFELDVLYADHLYVCYNYLEVCKLRDCAESLLVLSRINDSSSGVNLVVNPIKRFGLATC